MSATKPTSLKIVLVGPKGSGKSRLANALASIDVGASGYDPTVGTRILEIERAEANPNGPPVPIELWDCSGDHRYEACWPAITRDAAGIAIVFDPRSQSQANEVKVWADWFCKNANLQNGQVWVFAFSSAVGKQKNLTVSAGDRSWSLPIVPVYVPLPQHVEGSQDDAQANGTEKPAEAPFLAEFDKFIQTVRTTIGK